MKCAECSFFAVVLGVSTFALGASVEGDKLQAGLINGLADALEQHLDADLYLDSTIKITTFHGPAHRDSLRAAAMHEPQDVEFIRWKSGRGQVKLDFAPQRDTSKRLSLWTGEKWVRWSTDPERMIIVKSAPGRLPSGADCFGWFNSVDFPSLGLRSIPGILRTGKVLNVQERNDEVHVRVLPYPESPHAEQEPLEIVIGRAPNVRPKSVQHDLYRPGDEDKPILRTRFIVDEWAEHPGGRHVPLSARRIRIQYHQTPDDQPYGEMQQLTRESMRIEPWDDDMHAAMFSVPKPKVGRRVSDQRNNTIYTVGSHEIYVEGIRFQTLEPIPPWPDDLAELGTVPDDSEGGGE